VTDEPPAIAVCPQCATQLAPTMLACPACGRLVYSDELTQFAQDAREAADRGDISGALAHWRNALALLPAESKQHQVISAKITELGEKVPFSAVPAPTSAAPKSTVGRVAAGAGAIALMAWKAKALLLGLTKGTTLFSMLLSFSVYWAVWGWQFAAGIILSIYIHEMGHVIALRRYGFKATAPMFIPGIGALIRLQQRIVNPREDAAIGLAGPIYGLGAAIASLGLWLATGGHMFAAIGAVGAWINLFNLLPVASLDGGRGFHAMNRLQKFLAAATVIGAWYATGDGLLILLAIVCVGRALGDKSNAEGYWTAAITYCALVIALTAVASVEKRIPIERPEQNSSQTAAITQLSIAEARTYAISSSSSFI
jgi:Zn-dependent protease